MNTIKREVTVFASHNNAGPSLCRTLFATPAMLKEYFVDVDAREPSVAASAPRHPDTERLGAWVQL